MFEEPDPVETQRRLNAARTCLDTLGLRVGQQFEYLFDFGDSWWHEVKPILDTFKSEVLRLQALTASTCV